MLNVDIATVAENTAPDQTLTLYHPKSLYLTAAVQVEIGPSSQHTVTSVLALRGCHDVLYAVNE